MTAEVMNSLVIRSQQGDAKAFGELYKETYPKTFNFLYRYVKDREDREDIVQDTLIYAWMNIGKFERRCDSSFSTWVYGSAKISVFEFYRKRYGWNRDRHYVDISDYLDILPDDNILPDEALAAAVADAAIDAADIDLEEKRELILEAVEKLLPKQKAVFQLRYLERKSIKDVEKITGMNENQIAANFWGAQENIVKYVQSPNWRKEIYKAASMKAVATKGKEGYKAASMKAVATKGKEGYKASGRKVSATKVAKRVMSPQDMNFISIYLKDL